MFTKLVKAKYFTKIDLAKGYWQIPMKESCKKVTAFQTPLGHMQFKYMPFGLQNAPATFARAMQLVLTDMTNTVHYFDDILVFSNDWHEHIVALDRVMTVLSTSGFTIKPSKMFVGFSQVEFLGHVVGNGTQRPQVDKLTKILKLEIPKTKKQVQSLLGLLNYYRKFIPNFAQLLKPITDLVKKNKPNKVQWNEQCSGSFEKIKTLFSSEPILILPDMTKTFTVRADASDLAIGAVLLQEREDTLMPCMYASRSLLPREVNYPIIEKECLAIVFALDRFKRYLLLSRFVIETDHRPLTVLKEKRAQNSRLMRWSILLQEYNFVIYPISGVSNVQADVMSRLTTNTIF